MTAESLEIEEKDTAFEMKKSYELPVLVDWGTLQDITLSAGLSGKSDGGSFCLPKLAFEAVVRRC